MTAVLHPPQLAEVRIVVPNVRWETYESLLHDLADCSAPRLTYDRGELEIMSPTLKHEKINRAIEILVSTLAAEMKIEVASFGSTTFKREDIERGFEPDSSFYCQNELRIRGKEELDLNIDPPPDLVFEVDITSSSVDKESLFAQFGVSEVWRYDGERIQILVFEAGRYEISATSLMLPFLTAAALSKFVVDYLTLTRVEWIEKVRDWAQQQKSVQNDD